MQNIKMIFFLFKNIKIIKFCVFESEFKKEKIYKNSIKHLISN